MEFRLANGELMIGESTSATVNRRLLLLDGGHQLTPSAVFTTISSLPRSSMTFTAMRFLSPKHEGLADRPGKVFPNAIAEIRLSGTFADCPTRPSSGKTPATP